jgi:hypothetical protein
MISCDIQLLLGLILYFSNGWFTRLKDLGNNMKEPYSRFFYHGAYEHDDISMDTGAYRQGTGKEGRHRCSQTQKNADIFWIGNRINPGVYSMAFQASDWEAFVPWF